MIGPLLLPPSFWLAFAAACLSHAPTLRDVIEAKQAASRAAAKEALVEPQATLAKLPACTSTAGALPVAALAKRRGAGSPRPRERRLRGYLVRTAAACTLMACGEACCNHCGGRWALAVSGTGQPGLSLELLAAEDEGASLSWGAMDCALPALDEIAPRVEVIVTGQERFREPSPQDVKVFPPHALAHMFRPQLFYRSICVVQPQRVRSGHGT